MPSSSLGAYVLGRIGRALVTTVGVVTLVFSLVRLVPGDPVDAVLGEQASPADRQALRAALHLDAPLGEQYTRFWADVLDGTLGHSFRDPSSSVRSRIAEVFPATIELSIAALLVAFGVAIPLGVVAAARRGTGWDSAASLLALLGLAVPTIWLGPLLVLAFGVKLRLLPLPGDDSTSFAALVLPALTVGTALGAVLTRQTRAAMLEVLSQAYVTAARARGLSNVSVLVKHALRSTLGPIMTVGAAQLGALLSGAVIAEKLFERPGLGNLFLEAFFARDLPVVQGVVLVVGVVYVAVNLGVDLLYAALDPRVRLA